MAFINMRALFIFTLISVVAIGCAGDPPPDGVAFYTSTSRLTDPGGSDDMLDALPDDIDGICDIANVQLTHITMLSQWKIPRAQWRLAKANHDIRDILDTLRVKGNGTLSVDRQLNDRILGACTKESIFSTGILRYKGYAARMRVGYFTNLYKGEKSIEFWRNVNNYGNSVPVDSAEFDNFTMYMKEVNKAIEHWVTEYWDADSGRWRVLDIRPEYLRSYGLDVDYHLPDEYFEFGWEAWKRINDPQFQNDAYSEGDLDGKSHIRYQMLMDFYSLLNHDVPGLFSDDGAMSRSSEDSLDLRFLKKDYADLNGEEIRELDSLADLLSGNPSVRELVEFYNSSGTLKIGSMTRDRYSFISREKDIFPGR